LKEYPPEVVDVELRLIVIAGEKIHPQQVPVVIALSRFTSKQE
jgi:hypothetical protein